MKYTVTLQRSFPTPNTKFISFYINWSRRAWQTLFILIQTKPRLRTKSYLNFLYLFQQLLYQTIWTKHNNNLREKSKHISKKNKRWYRRPTNTTTNLTSHTTQDSPNLSSDDIILTPPLAPVRSHPFFLPFPCCFINDRKYDFFFEEVGFIRVQQVQQFSFCKGSRHCQFLK